MRMLLRVRMECAAANKAIQDGTLPKLIQGFVKEHKPEASYFTADGGKRTAFFVFDLKSTSDIPVIAEPWFMATKALVDLMPAMNIEDVGKGIEAWSKQKG